MRKLILLFLPLVFSSCKDHDVVDSSSETPESRVPAINLIITAPPGEAPNKPADLIIYIEGHELELKPGKSEPSNFDYYQTMGALQTLAGNSGYRFD